MRNGSEDWHSQFATSTFKFIMTCSKLEAPMTDFSSSLSSARSFLNIWRNISVSWAVRPRKVWYSLQQSRAVKVSSHILISKSATRTYSWANLNDPAQTSCSTQLGSSAMTRMVFIGCTYVSLCVLIFESDANPSCTAQLNGVIHAEEGLFCDQKRFLTLARWRLLKKNLAAWYSFLDIFFRLSFFLLHNSGWQFY